MSTLSIVRLGHPALRTPANPIDLKRLAESEYQDLIDNMLEIMQAEGGVGLAAPQVGILEQLIVYANVDPDAEFQTRPELKVLVNPMIVPEGREMVYDWEGCLSIPDLRGLVPRHPAVRVHGFDRHGQRLDYPADGYEARIVQHEFDHLNGVVFLDRMRDLRSLSFAAEWEEYMISDEGDEGVAVG